MESYGLPMVFGKIVLRPMTRQDVDDMARWPYHLDPFYSRGSRLPSTKLGRDRWWRMHNNPPKTVLLGADDHMSHLVGRVSVTVVDEEEKEGLMGIRIRPDKESDGLGTSLLQAFFEYWFVQRRMERLMFDAHSFNAKAIACYAKVGVPVVGYHYEYMPHHVGEEGVDETGYVKFMDYRLTKIEYMEKVRVLGNAPVIV